MDITNDVARNVKALRERKKLTLDGAAELTGVSRSMLAQIEKGDVNPTISVLWKIAIGYKVSFSALVEQGRERTQVLRTPQPLEEDGGRYRIYPAFTFGEGTPFECYRVEIEPGGGLSAQPHMRGTEEFLTVFAGTAEITVDAEVFRLAPGDSIRFFADVPHGYRNAGGQTVEMNMLICYEK